MSDQKNKGLCEKCPVSERLPALFIVTRLGQKNTLIDVCAVCLDRFVKNGSTTYALLTVFRFFRRMASEHRNLLVHKTGKDGELCSVPDCQEEPGSKAVAVFGRHYPICGGCCNAAFAVATRFDGPFPCDRKEAVERAAEWRKGREQRSTELAAKYTAKLGSGTKPEPPKKPEPPQGPNKPRGGKRRRRGGKKRHEAAKAIETGTQPPSNDPRPMTTVNVVSLKVVRAKRERTHNTVRWRRGAFIGIVCANLARLAGEEVEIIRPAAA